MLQWVQREGNLYSDTMGPEEGGGSIHNGTEGRGVYPLIQWDQKERGSILWYNGIRLNLVWGTSTKWTDGHTWLKTLPSRKYLQLCFSLYSGIPHLYQLFKKWSCRICQKAVGTMYVFLSGGSYLSRNHYVSMSIIKICMSRSRSKLRLVPFEMAWHSIRFLSFQWFDICTNICSICPCSSYSAFSKCVNVQLRSPDILQRRWGPQKWYTKVSLIIIFVWRLWVHRSTCTMA